MAKAQHKSKVDDAMKRAAAAADTSPAGAAAVDTAHADKMEAAPGNADAVGTVAVRMRSILSGDRWSVGPGEIVAVDSDEAMRLIGLGVADAVDA